MIEAMKRLDNKGFFGTGEDREKVVINVEIAPPDGIEKENGLLCILKGKMQRSFGIIQNMVLQGGVRRRI